jgi:hypothetical protein
MVKKQRLLVVILTVISFSLAGLWIGLYVQYSDTRPRNAQPSIGRIYAINNHGTTVFLTKQEQWKVWITQYGALICGMAAGVVSMRKQ